MRFIEKVSVVTGAGSGIGAATAMRLAEEGARVILVGRTEQKLSSVAHEMNLRHPDTASFFVADVTKEEDVLQLFQHVKEKHGRLHVLVNNAGAAATTNIRDIPVDEWDHLLSLNLRSVFLVSRVLAELMTAVGDEEAGWQTNAIVNVASLSGHKAAARMPHYSASKAAVINLTRTLANEYGRFGIRVNSVSPGFVDTPLMENGMKNPRFIESLRRNTVLGRAALPKEIANVIAFVASSEASYMTGSDILVDGGWMIK